MLYIAQRTLYTSVLWYRNYSNTLDNALAVCWNPPIGGPLFPFVFPLLGFLNNVAVGLLMNNSL